MNCLHFKSMIQHPIHMEKSVVLIDAGLKRSTLLLEKLFGTQKPPGSRDPGNN